MRDGFTPWLDLNANAPASAPKLSQRANKNERPRQNNLALHFAHGIRWQQGPKLGVEVGDNTTIFYNPFREKWVFSVRSGEAAWAGAILLRGPASSPNSPR